VRSNRAEADAVVKEIESKGGKAMAALADVTDAQAVNAMAAVALKQFGRIDCLINNVAQRGEKAIEDMSFEEWRLITGVVLDGAFHCVKACLPAIKQSDMGSIVNVGGLTGAMGAPDRAHVVTAKAGIAGFSRALAMELAPHKITVNTLVPAMLAKPDRPDDIPSHPLYRPRLGRAAWPTDFAPLARFMVGPGARYMTGQTINVNGGTYFG
jgi:NAD(P)-dependent dehydrogenase (short-subunit alcohol dehydrogenase family)